MKRFVFGLLMMGVACAAQAASEGVSISDARLRLLPGDLPMAGYFVLHNGSDHAVQLTGAACSAFRMVMMHRTVHENGMDRMVMIKAITVAPGKSVEFAPGGYHLMLMHRKHPMHIGDKVPVTLRVSGKDMPIEFQVVGATAQ